LDDLKPFFEVYNTFMVPEVETFEHQIQLIMPQKYVADILLVEISGKIKSSFEIQDNKGSLLKESESFYHDHIHKAEIKIK
jgi:Holliday junction resolvase RusA-like endonuclease